MGSNVLGAAVFFRFPVVEADETQLECAAFVNALEDALDLALLVVRGAQQTAEHQLAARVNVMVDQVAAKLGVLRGDLAQLEGFLVAEVASRARVVDQVAQLVELIAVQRLRVVQGGGKAFAPVDEGLGGPPRRGGGGRGGHGGSSGAQGVLSDVVQPLDEFGLTFELAGLFEHHLGGAQDDDAGDGQPFFVLGVEVMHDRAAQAEVAA